MTFKVPATAQEISETTPRLDQMLVEQCVRGDQVAWRMLHRRYYPVVSAFLRKLGVRNTEVEDIAQELFIQVFRYLPSFRGEAQLKTWLYKLCISQARRARGRATLREQLRRLVQLAPEQVAPKSHSFTEADARSKIEAALSTMPEKQRTVFVLYEMENVPGKQIAEILECPQPTVWRRLHDARRSFEQALENPSGAAGRRRA
jgi:RNA polymerase sigma-70 factor, ECF subfamily